MHAPGREQSTCNKVRKTIPANVLEDAFVMRRERVRKFHGAWETDTVPMFKDYFFVVTRDVNALDRALARLSFPAAVCKGEDHFYAPMAEEARAWYERMMDDTHTIRTSTAVYAQGELRILTGPMVGQEARIIKVIRRKSMCQVAVGEGGHGYEELIPLVVKS